MRSRDDAGNTIVLPSGTLTMNALIAPLTSVAYRPVDTRGNLVHVEVVPAPADCTSE